MSKAWSPDEDRVLREMWPTHSAPEIASTLSRSPMAVILRSRRIDLPRRFYRPPGKVKNWKCRSCKRKFVSEHALIIHRAKVHGIVGWRSKSSKGLPKQLLARGGNWDSSKALSFFVDHWRAA